jgi:hypothetical protein
MAAGRPQRRARLEPLVVVRLAFGVALIVAPGRLLLACSAVDDRRARIVARILGLRHLVEGGVLLIFDTRAVGLAGAAVDGIHAATALTFAIVDRRRRRGALINAVAALFFTAVGLARARSRDM